MLRRLQGRRSHTTSILRLAGIIASFQRWVLAVVRLFSGWPADVVFQGIEILHCVESQLFSYPTLDSLLPPTGLMQRLSGCDDYQLVC